MTISNYQQQPHKHTTNFSHSQQLYLGNKILFSYILHWVISIYDLDITQIPDNSAVEKSEDTLH